MKTISLILFQIFSFISLASFAQKHSDSERTLGSDRTSALAGRTDLIVLLQTPDEEVMEHLKKNNNKSGEDYYLNIIESYNQTIKNASEETWSDVLHIHYMTIEELKNALETFDANKYLVLYTLYIEMERSTDNSISSFYFYQFPLKANDLKSVPLKNETKTWYIPKYEFTDVYGMTGDWDYGIHIKPLEDFVMKPYRSNLSKVAGAIDYEMTHWIETDNFYRYSLNYLKSQYKAIIANPKKDYETFYSENAAQLRELVLAIPEEYFADDKILAEQRGGDKLIELTLTAEEFESIYPYKFEIVNADDLNAIISEQTFGYAYLIYSTSVRSEISMVVMSATDGHMILVSKPLDKKNNYYSDYLLADHLNTVIEYVGH